MLLFRNLTVSLGSDEDRLPSMLERRLHLQRGSIRHLDILKKSLDARKGRKPRFVYSLALKVDFPIERKLLKRDNPVVEAYTPAARVEFPSVAWKPGEARPVVVGAGPAGLFAAYRLARAGTPPIVLERGPEVVDRSKRWYKFLQGEAFDPECNLLFGEGGAGAYSDGKLYTRVNDPRCREVLEVLAKHGAPKDILFDAKPHIGSNLLPSVVKRFREALIRDGVEFRFSTRMRGLVTRGDGPDRRLRGIDIEPGGTLECNSVFLATGHSARDVYRMLADADIALEQKAFQMGVRVEHPQPLIDRIQYGGSAGFPGLPPAEYQYVAKRREGDVFSFCMCPGGEILPATEKEGFICVNGASKSKRLSPYANSGFVVTVNPDQFPDPDDALSGMHLQETVERAAADAASGVPFGVPALRIRDFLEGRCSVTFPSSSYPFPLVGHQLEGILPDSVLGALREGFEILGRRYRGFLDDDAVVVAPESRSSSPLRILRDPETHTSPSVAGLYPMGEGAGYAGGIVSAAMDGLRCAESWCQAQVS